MSAPRTRIEEVMFEKLTRVRPAGPENSVALCPFHDDSTPSFAMNIYNGLFICYACNVRGSFRKFLEMLGLNKQEIQLNYGKTIEDLKRHQPPAPDPTQPEMEMAANAHVPENLLGLFQRYPIADLNEIVCDKRILEDFRAFDPKILKEFGVGVDQDHDRITFPLRDMKGNLVGISGRDMTGEAPERYKVYVREYKKWDLPEYRTDKDKLLWNCHRVYPEVYRKNDVEIVLVEGFKACMWLRQAGVPYVMAFMTAHMSKAQKWILERLGATYTLMLDMNEAGIGGTIDIGTALLKTSRVKVVEYDAEQPTDLPLEEIPGLIANARSYNHIALS